MDLKVTSTLPIRFSALADTFAASGVVDEVKAAVAEVSPFDIVAWSVILPLLAESVTGMSFFAPSALPNMFFIVIIMVDVDFPLAEISVGFADKSSFEGLFHKKIKIAAMIIRIMITMITPINQPGIPLVAIICWHLWFCVCCPSGQLRGVHALSTQDSLC